MSATLEKQTAPCLDAALEYHGDGLAITICREKAPIGEAWQHREWAEAEIESQYRRDPTHNVGAILGPRSGIIDLECDEPGAEDDFVRLFEGCEIDVAPTFGSRRGKHRLFGWNDRLDAVANLPGVDTEKKGAVVKFGALEVRLGANGRGAQSLLPPSTTGGVTREWFPGLSLAECNPPQLPDEVIDRIVAEAVKQFTPDVVPESNGAAVSGHRPGDYFNRDGSWVAVFNDTDWIEDRVSGNVTYWRRPGKPAGDGWSASTGFCHREGVGDLLYVFSSSAAPFKQEHAYSKFTAFALLHHGGDFSAAASELAKAGYGRPSIYGGSAADLDQIAGECWKAIKRANDPPSLFRSGGVATWIERDDDGRPVLKLMTLDRWRLYLSRVASWYQVRGKGDKATKHPCEPREKAVKNVSATPDKPLPILTRIVEVPVFAPNGTLQTEPGYHPASKTYYGSSEKI